MPFEKLSNYRSVIYVIFFLLWPFYFCENENYPYYITSNDHGVIWVSNSADNSVTCINRLSDEEIGTFPVGPDPSRTAVDKDGNCWVGCRGDASVYFVTQTGIIRRYEGFYNARGVALDKNGNVWIANSGNATIQKISLPDTSISAQLLITQLSDYFYGALVDGSNNLWILDRTNFRMIKYCIDLFPDPSAHKVIQLPGPIYGFTIDKNNIVWVSGYNTANLYKIDAKTATILASYTIPSDFFTGNLTGVTFDTYGNIWISTFVEGNSVLRFNPQTESFDKFSVQGLCPHGLGADDMGFIYTINLYSNDISKIDAETGKLIKKYTVGRSPYTYSDLTGFIYRNVTLGSGY